MDDLDRRIRAAIRELEPPAEAAPELETIRSRAIRRRRRRRWTPLVAIAVAVALVTGVLYLRPRGETTLQTTSPTGLSAPAGSATAAELAAGQWSQLPPGPVSTPSEGIWAGTELLAWGSIGTSPASVDFSRGAAYRPSTRSWQPIAPAPFSVPQGLGVWTGKEVIFLGGSPAQAGTDGAAYNPSTNRWRRLPKSPLDWGTRFAVWTGSRLMAFGSAGTASSSPPAVAAYDPATNHWTTIGLPDPPVEHGIGWESAVAIKGEVLVWSGWQITSTAGPSLAGSGVDLYAYNERTGRWSLRAPTANAMVAADSEFLVGNSVLVTGWPYIPCPNCNGGTLADVVGSYDPASNTWGRLPSLTGESFPGTRYLSTGAALVGIGDGDPSPVVVFDSVTNAWQALPPAPGTGCLQRAWTGSQIVTLCNGDWLAFTPAAQESPRPAPAR